MTSPETAAAALSKIRLLKTAAEDAVALRQENAELKRQLREMSTRHDEAVLDLLAKGKKLEDLMRHVIDDRNRIAAQLTSLQSGPGRRTSACQTENSDRASKSANRDVSAQCNMEEAPARAEPGSPVPAMLLLSPEASVSNDPPAGLPAALSVIHSPLESSSRQPLVLESMELQNIPAACVLGLPQRQAATIALLVHLMSAEAIASSSGVRVRWVVRGASAFIGLVDADGSLEWFRVKGKPTSEVVGLSETGREIAWCSALAWAIEETTPLRNVSLSSLVRRATSNRLHGPFPLEGLKLSVVSSRIDEFGDSLLLDGVDGEAVVTSTAQLGKSRVFLVASVHDVAGQNQVVGSWLSAEEIARRFTTITVAERWPRPDCYTEMRIPVTVSGGCCDVLLAPATSAPYLTVSCDVSLFCRTEGAAVAHMCTFVPCCKGDAFAVQCETVLDSDRATLVLVAEVDPRTGAPLCKTLRLGRALENETFAEAPIVVQIDGAEKLTDEAFPCSPQREPHVALHQATQCGDGDVFADEISHDVVLVEQRTMVETMQRLAAQIDAIELNALTRTMPLVAMNAELVCDHFSRCHALYDCTSRLLPWPGTYAVMDVWFDGALRVATEHAMTEVLPAVHEALCAGPLFERQQSAMLLQWNLDALDLVALSGATQKFDLFMDCSPLSLAAAHADESFPWADDFVLYCTRWAGASELMWQRALAVSCAAIDELAGACERIGPATAYRATASLGCDATTNTDAVAPMVAQQACGMAASAAQLAMFRDPFLQMLQHQSDLERQSFLLRMTLARKEDALRDAASHLSNLAIGNDALAAELGARDVELSEACRRLQQSLITSDELQSEVFELRSGMARLNGSQHILTERHAQLVSEKSRTISSLEAEVSSLRNQLEALRPALFSLTAPTESDMRSVAGSVVSRQPISPGAKKGGRLPRR